MTKQEALKNLRAVLASLYEKPEDAKRVAEDSGLNTSNIDFTESMINIWREILREAHKDQRVEALVTTASQDYASRSTELQRSYGAYNAAGEDGEEFDNSPSYQPAPPVSKPPTAESTQNRFPTLWIGVLGVAIVLAIVAIVRWPWRNPPAPVPPTAISSPSTETTETSVAAQTPSPMPAPCQVALGSDFAVLGQQFRDLIGCPITPAKPIPLIAEEQFEGGYMFWRNDTNEVYVIYDRVIGGEELFKGKWETNSAWNWQKAGEPDPEGIGLSPPADLVEPKRGFGWVWRTYLGRENGTLGWALKAEKGSENGEVQEFEKGIVIKGSSTKVYLLLNDSTFVAAP